MEKKIPDYVEALQYRNNIENVEILNRVYRIQRMKNPINERVYFSNRSGQNRSSAFVSLWIENGKTRRKSFTIGRVANPTYEKARENATEHNNQMKLLHSTNKDDKLL